MHNFRNIQSKLLSRVTNEYLYALHSRKLLQCHNSWQPMTSHVIVSDGENLAQNRLIDTDGVGMKQFTHGPMVDINDSVQYYALDNSVINK